MNELTWLAESPTIPGYYARRTPARVGAMGELLEYGSYSVNDAQQFNTENECIEYCQASDLKWEPKQHILS